MTVVRTEWTGPWEARLHDLRIHPAINVTPGMAWVCSIQRAEQLVMTGPAHGSVSVLGAVFAVAASGWGDTSDEALCAALWEWIDSGVRGDE